MAYAVSRPRTSGLRASGTTPAERGGAVPAAEHPYEVVRLRHAPFADPLQNCPPRLAPDDRGEVPRRESHGPCDVLERDRLVVAFLDEAEYPSDQRLVLEPEVPTTSTASLESSTSRSVRCERAASR